MSRAKLISNSDANPLNLVLGTYETVSWYIQKVRAAESKWPAMTVPQRMSFLTDLALEVLDDLKISPPRSVGATQHMGAFEPSTWRIFLVKPLFIDSTPADIAAQAGHVFHEFEHLAATYIAARYLAAEKQNAENIAQTLDIPSDIAKEAAQDALPSNLLALGKGCHFRVTCEKNPTAPTDYYRSLHANIRKLQAELKLAEDNLSKLERSSDFSASTFKAAYARKRRIDTELAAAHREYQLSETEIGSNVVENLVKTRLLQQASTAP